MNQTNMTLWQVIDALVQTLPLSKQMVETILSTQLVEYEDANPFFHFFKFQSPPVALTEGVVILDVDLRISKRGHHPGLLGLKIDGACVTLDQIRARYDQLKVTGSPRGGSLDEQRSYSQYLPWGELAFGFAERNPRCLASIAFHPKKDTA